MKTPEAVRAIDYVPSIGNFLTMVLLSFCAIMLLPRQFHVSVVENSSDAEVRPGALAVSALSGRHQPVRDSDRARGPHHLSVRRGRQRHVRAGVADGGKCSPAQRRRLRRRPVGGDRHGDRGMRRAFDHGLERHRRAAGAAARARNRPRARRTSATSCSRFAVSRSSPSW